MRFPFSNKKFRSRLYNFHFKNIISDFSKEEIERYAFTKKPKINSGIHFRYKIFQPIASLKSLQKVSADFNVNFLRILERHQ